ncbi:MAG: winged helix-turn-helix transcriptional regulator [Rhizobiaceae bacterium]|nr:winged helix-turn-helix transcriptional regulator [Rhizobiaceae bacterium]
MNDKSPLSEESFEKAAELLSLLAEPKRLRILSVTSKEEISVSALAERIGVGKTLISHHLGTLRMHNAVETREAGTLVYYRCTSPTIHKMIATIEEIVDAAQ